MLKSLSSEVLMGSMLEICDRAMIIGALVCIVCLSACICIGAEILECLENLGDSEIFCGLGEVSSSNGGDSGMDSIGCDLIQTLSLVSFWIPLMSAG
jgi:hypothetical protein